MRHFSLRADPLGGLDLFRATPLEDLGVEAFFTSRRGGVSSGPYDSLNLGDHVHDDPSRVEHNRRRLAHALGVHHLGFPRQVHGTTLVEATELAQNSPRAADAVATESSLPALVLVADCLPVIVVDISAHRLVVAHAGWRGLAAGVLDTALAGLDPSHVSVVIGPSISAKVYQVGPEVVRAHESFARHCVDDGGDRSRLDLRGAAATWLSARGVAEDRIWVSREVTDGGGIFFSDRASRPCGRFAAVARWT